MIIYDVLVLFVVATRGWRHVSSETWVSWGTTVESLNNCVWNWFLDRIFRPKWCGRRTHNICTSTLNHPKEDSWHALLFISFMPGSQPNISKHDLSENRPSLNSKSSLNPDFDPQPASGASLNSYSAWFVYSTSHCFGDLAMCQWAPFCSIPW